jgi:hypothetical protein
MCMKIVAAMAGVLLAIASGFAAAQAAPADEMPRTPEAKAALTRMEVAIKKAEDSYRQAVIAARQQAIRDLDTALKTALRNQNLDESNRIAARKKALEAEIDEILKRAKPAAAVTAPKEGFYISLLGQYHQGLTNPRKLHPCVNLSVPNGDLWTERIQADLRGKIDFHEIAYEGIARLFIPSDGKYTFEAGNCFVRIDGKAIAQSMSANTTLDLKKGMYEVSVFTDTHGGPYLPKASVRIIDTRTNQPIPLVNSSADIERFLNSEVDGQKVKEMSGWKPTAQNLVRVDPALLER